MCPPWDDDGKEFVDSVLGEVGCDRVVPFEFAVWLTFTSNSAQGGRVPAGP